MISGDDFYDDEITSGLDPIETRRRVVLDRLRAAESAEQEREARRQEVGRCTNRGPGRD